MVFLRKCSQQAVSQVNTVTDMLQAMHRREPGAADRLARAVYEELRRLSRARMANEYANRTLQTTALVHEAWLRLGGDEQADWQNRAHFFTAAATAMRRILIERGRRRQRERHGAGQARINIDDVELPDRIANEERLVAIGEALERLGEVAPQQAEIVNLRIFVGLTLEEAAQTLGITVRTASRWWAFARAWLARELDS